MKTLLSKILFLLLFMLPSITLATDHDKWGGKYTKEKKIKKEFTVSNNALLKVSNKYGNLTIISWNKDKIVIEVNIKTNGNNEDKVQQKLDEITVNFDATRDMVAAKTQFEKNRWGWNKRNNVHMEINYTIKVPVTNKVDLNNDYGSIKLDKLENTAKIYCDYGKLIIGELLADGNYLSFDYTTKSTIAYIKSGKINADYSKFALGETENLILNADYTHSKIKNAKNIEYTCDYGKLDIEKATKISGSGDYLTTTFGTIHGNIAIDSDYGCIKIKQLTPKAKNINIQADYTSINIGYDPDYHFNFEIKLHYAGLKTNDELQFNIKKKENSSKYYKGYFGEKNTSNNIKINSNYGSVTLNNTNQ